MAAPGYTSTQQSYGPGIMVVTAGLGFNAGAALDALTPTRFGLIQSINFEADLKLKAAYGLGVFPVGYGSGQGTIKWKAKALSISGWLMNALMYGQGAQPPQGYQIVYNSSQTIPATPYTVVIAAAKQDLGVFYAPGTTYPTGVFSQQLLQVASGPVQGQYSFAPGTGTWTFAATDTAKVVLVTYATQPASPYYEQWQFANPIQGQPPVFAIQFAPFFNGQTHRITMPNAVCSKISLPTKQGDWVEYEIDGEAFTVGESGNIFTEDMLAL